MCIVSVLYFFLYLPSPPPFHKPFEFSFSCNTYSVAFEIFIVPLPKIILNFLFALFSDPIRHKNNRPTDYTVAAFRLRENLIFLFSPPKLIAPRHSLKGERLGSTVKVHSRNFYPLVLVTANRNDTLRSIDFLKVRIEEKHR